MMTVVVAPHLMLVRVTQVAVQVVKAAAVVKIAFKRQASILKMTKMARKTQPRLNLSRSMYQLR